MKKLKLLLVKGGKHYVRVFVFPNHKELRAYADDYEKNADTQLKPWQKNIDPDIFKHAKGYCYKCIDPKYLIADVLVVEGELPEIAHELYHAAHWWRKNIPKGVYEFVTITGKKRSKPDTEEELAVTVEQLLREYLKKVDKALIIDES